MRPALSSGIAKLVRVRLARRALMARSESAALVNFAKKSKDLRVQHRAMFHETLDALLDVCDMSVQRFGKRMMTHVGQSQESRSWYH